jgi:hypothetical protein
MYDAKLNSRFQFGQARDKAARGEVNPAPSPGVTAGESAVRQSASAPLQLKPRTGGPPVYRPAPNPVAPPAVYRPAVSPLLQRKAGTAAPPVYRPTPKPVAPRAVSRPAVCPLLQRKAGTAAPPVYRPIPNPVAPPAVYRPAVSPLLQRKAWTGAPAVLRPTPTSVAPPSVYRPGVSATSHWEVRGGVRSQSAGVAAPHRAFDVVQQPPPNSRSVQRQVRFKQMTGEITTPTADQIKTWMSSGGFSITDWEIRSMMEAKAEHTYDWAYDQRRLAADIPKIHRRQVRKDQKKHMLWLAESAASFDFKQCGLSPLLPHDWGGCQATTTCPVTKCSGGSPARHPRSSYK